MSDNNPPKGRKTPSVASSPDDDLYLVHILSLMKGGIEALEGDLEERSGEPRTNFARALNFAGQVNAEEIVSHRIFRDEFPEFSALSDGTPETTRALIERPEYMEAAARTAVSIGLERYAEAAIKRGVKYEFGAKDGIDSVDCSGFVQNAVNNMLGMENTSAMFAANMGDMLKTHSEGQIQALSQQSGFMLSNSQISRDTLRAGMVIGIDSGDKGWDSGRALGVDHVVMVYRDTESGELMVAESRGGTGVMAQSAETWLSMAQDKYDNLYATDLVKMASIDHQNTLSTSATQDLALTASAEPTSYQP